MRQGVLQIIFMSVGLGLSAQLAAQDQGSDAQTPGFKFQANTPLLDPRVFSSLDENRADSKARYRLLQPDNRARSYDAILYYPLHRKGVSLDVGLNLRMQEESSNQTEFQAFERDWLDIDPSETQTLIHAAAVFDLPFNGLKAGLSGTYNADLANTEYDYRAQLSYKWRNGFGMEGGWQHQQRLDEQQNFNESMDVQTLFLDMKFRF